MLIAYIKRIIVSTFVLLFIVAPHSFVHAGSVYVSALNVVSEQVGQTYKIKGYFKPEGNTSPVQSLKIIAKKSDGTGTPFQKTLTGPFTADTVYDFESNNQIPAGSYEYYFTLADNTQVSDNSLITLGQTGGPGVPYNASFITTFSDVKLTQQQGGTYRFEGKFKIEGATGSFPKYYIKTTGNNGATSDTPHAVSHQFGQTVSFLETGHVLPPPYNYQLFIDYQGSKQAASSVQSVALTTDDDVVQNPPGEEDDDVDVVQDPPGKTDDTGGNGGSPKELLANPLKVNSIQGLLAEILKILLIVAIPVIGIFIVIAGFKYVMARGKSEDLETAHRNLLYVVVGAALIIGCILIVDVITNTVNDIKADVKTQ